MLLQSAVLDYVLLASGATMLSRSQNALILAIGCLLNALTSNPYFLVFPCNLPFAPCKIVQYKVGSFLRNC
jgi:molybdopterin-guanine dinucleotide biosynthesis protein A